jgi:hypothetical protein
MTWRCRTHELGGDRETAGEKCVLEIKIFCFIPNNIIDLIKSTPSAEVALSHLLRAPKISEKKREKVDHLGQGPI